MILSIYYLIILESIILLKKSNKRTNNEYHVANDIKHNERNQLITGQDR